jgi:phosphoribosylformimino-5-aminoimidazole carboxamide ribotide isomerase
MQIIPVLDLAHGLAVHAKAGERSRYAPLKSVLVPDRDGAPLALLKAFHTELGAHECYVADLDAIQGGAVQRGLIRQLAELYTGFAGALLVDAGTSSTSGALEVLSCGASEVIIGLETLRAFADLAAIINLVGPARAVFSLDLRLGTPMLHPAMQGAVADPLSLAARAVDAGVSTLLLLDVGRVGTGCGIDLGLLDLLRRRFLASRLLAGGGVSTRCDLDRLRDAGCDGVLIASAIHSGRVTAFDLAELGGPRSWPGQSGTSPSR